MIEAEKRVRAYLDAMESRDLVAAQNALAPGFSMTFPGGVSMNSLNALVDWARTRYARVSKTYERFDSVAAEDAQVVYCFGTLSGEWLDGLAFSGIRFIDRFELKDGLIIRQDVWNDMGEARKNG